MAKLHFWTGVDAGLTEAAHLDPSGSTLFPVLSGRSFNDTSVRSVWFPQIRSRTTGSGVAGTKWWVSAKVDFVVTADPFGTSTVRDYSVDDPSILGICQLTPSVYYAPTVNDMTILWNGPAIGLNLESGRLGDGTNFNSVIGQFNHTDQHGVFAGVFAASTLFDISLSGRVLWATDTPRPP